MSDSGEFPTMQATGETLGEAKWRAVRKMRVHYPGLRADEVKFNILESGEGEGSEARVEAALDVELWRQRKTVFELADDPAERVRGVLEKVTNALSLQATVSIEERDEELVASVDGPDMGLFIGKHGQMIDAVQYVAGIAAYRGSRSGKRVIVDAAGYRERRALAIHRQADRAASEALRHNKPVDMPAMNAFERRIVHVHLADKHDVTTHSVGDDPDRHVVVATLG